MVSALAVLIPSQWRYHCYLPSQWRYQGSERPCSRSESHSWSLSKPCFESTSCHLRNPCLYFTRMNNLDWKCKILNHETFWMKVFHFHREGQFGRKGTRGGWTALKYEVESRGRRSCKGRSGPHWEQLPQSRTRMADVYRATWVSIGIQDWARSSVYHQSYFSRNILETTLRIV